MKESELIFRMISSPKTMILIDHFQMSQDCQFLIRETSKIQLLKKLTQLRTITVYSHSFQSTTLTGSL